MPTIPQTEVPVPKSWDEFEDIVADLYIRLWDDPHAQPGSKTEQLAQKVVGWGKPVHTLDHLANERLLALGVLRYLSAGMPFVRPGCLPTR